MHKDKINIFAIQYLKNDNENGDKKTQLKNLEFDVCIFDESDFGSSTENTITDILNFTKSIQNEFKCNRKFPCSISFF